MSLNARQLKPDQPHWYVVPPYANEGWRILNEAGELVAVFEDREECALVVQLFNARNEP